MAEEETPSSSEHDASAQRPAESAVAAQAEPTSVRAKGTTGREGKGRHEMARRKFIWASVFGVIGVYLLATVRFFFPRALFEPQTRFAIGYPADFGLGVSTRFQQSHRIWVVRDSSSLYVIFARCTHLGCTPDWKEGENKFKCPCHGSGFDTEGINFEGPAPKPLERVHVALDAEGRIVVDKARLYGPGQWKDSGVFLAV